MEIESKDDEIEVHKEGFVCKLCDVKAVSENQLNQHLVGKKHKDKLEKKNSEDSKTGKRIVYINYKNVSKNIVDPT